MAPRGSRHLHDLGADTFHDGMGHCIWPFWTRKPCTIQAPVVAAEICHSRSDTPALVLARRIRISWGRFDATPMAAATHPKISITLSG